MKNLEKTLLIVLHNECPAFVSRFKLMYSGASFCVFRSYAYHHEEQVILYKSSNKYIQVIRTWYSGNYMGQIDCCSFTSMVKLTNFLNKLYQID